jgi:hypothetical protein
MIWLRHDLRFAHELNCALCPAGQFMTEGQFMPSGNSRAVGRNSLSRQSNDCLDMPWDNGVNKNAVIHADNSTVLVA